MELVKGSKIFKIIMPVLLIVALLVSFMGAGTAVLADSLPLPMHTDNLVVGGQFNPGTQGTELDILIEGGLSLPGWCVNEHVDIYVNTQYTADIYGYLDYFGESYPANIGLLPSAVITNTYSQTVINWPAIAYIINHKAPGASSMDIQKAIWYFSDNDYFNFNSYTQAMVEETNSYLDTHNGVYVPAAGQLEPRICYVPGTTPLQVIFYEYTVPAMPDLVITFVTTTADPIDPTWYSVSFTIKNQGTAEASASVASIEVDGGEISNPFCPALAAGESAVVAVPSRELADTVDTDTIKVIADINQTVVESNESNNASAIISYSIFTIAASSGPNGSITPSGNIIVGQETSRSFSIEANGGYHIADVLVDGISVGQSSNYNFENITANHSIAASFAAKQYTITFDSNGGTAVDPITADYGAAINAPADPSREGYTFSGWNPAFPATMPLNGAALTAQWTINTYTITWMNGASQLEQDLNVPYGTMPEYNGGTPTKEATAQYTYTFSGWDPVLANVAGDQTYTALFSATVNQYSVTFKNYDGSTLSTQSVAYASGAAAPSDPSRPADAQYTYTFAGWDVAFNNITTDLTVTATYTATVNQYSVTFDLGAHGSLISGELVQSINYGGDAVAPALSVENGWTFTGWDNSFTNVTGNLTVNAQYSQNGYNLTINAVNGTVEGVPAGPYLAGTVVNLTAHPATGYLFSSWSGDLAGNTNPASLTMDGNKNITAVFTVNQGNIYTIIPGAGPNGTISTSTAVSVYQGDSTTFNFTPAPGYHVSDVLVDVISVGAPTSYAFNNVTANHTIMVLFAESEYTLTINVTGSGTVSVDKNGPYHLNDRIALNAVPAQDWNFVHWYGDINGQINPATVTMIGNKTINVLFAEVTHVINASAGANGMISSTGNVLIADGESQTFTITNWLGYIIADVLVDGSSVGPVTSYTFDNVTADHTISATFSVEAGFHGWDIDGNHLCSVVDLIQIGNHMGEKGTPGWIFEDANQDGTISVLDLIFVGNHIGKSW